MTNETFPDAVRELIYQVQDGLYEHDLPVLLADWLEAPSMKGATSEDLGVELAHLVFIWLDTEGVTIPDDHR